MPERAPCQLDRQHDRDGCEDGAPHEDEQQPGSGGRVALAANADARLAGLRSALGILAVLALLALFLAQAIPTRPIGIDERKE